ncbi:MAG: helix-turn-helix domain-containing protein [bacterium]
MIIKKVEDVAKIIKEARIKQDLTQVKLAQLCGVGTRFIIDLEKAKPTCQIDKILKVVVRLGIKLSDE